MNNKHFRVLSLVGVNSSIGNLIAKFLEKRLIEEKDGMTPNCLSCDFFDEPRETCLKFNVRPPARVIALACEHYKDKDDIPF